MVVSGLAGWAAGTFDAGAAAGLVTGLKCGLVWLYRELYSTKRGRARGAVPAGAKGGRGSRPEHRMCPAGKTAIGSTLMRIALFAPCFVDQLYPGVAMAALRVLERLGIAVDVPTGAACCGQPAANAGFEERSLGAISRFVETFDPYDRVVMLSGSCALHVRHHATDRVASKAVEFTGFLHDDVGIEHIATIGRRVDRRIAVHIGCHALRGLGLATPTEILTPQPDKVRAVLGAIDGVSFADLARPDECCGFGGTFAVGEPAVSAKMGRDRLRDYSSHHADVVVSTDPSCMMHLAGLARGDGNMMPVMHVAELLALAIA